MLSHFSVILGVLAGMTQLYGYWIYNVRAVGKINTGSWALWALGGLIDLVSYFALTRDWVVNLLPVACAAAAIGTFLYALLKRRFSPLERIDYGFLALDLVITALWYFTNVVVANLLYQVSNALTFVPILRGLHSGVDHEEPMPWLVWALAYSLLTVSVLLRLERWEELAYPVSHVVTHLLVAIVALRARSPYARV